MGIEIIAFIAIAIFAICVMGFNFFYNPFGLGPAPASVLPERFFHRPAESLAALELLIDGVEAFDKALELINAAKETVRVQTFIWKDDDIGRKMVSALITAADRGVKVSVSKDVVGTFFEARDMLKGHPSPVYADKRFKGHANINVMTDLFKDTDHSKYFIIDGRWAIFGGMNIADEYHKKWHDYMALIDSSQWTQAFGAKVLDDSAWPDEAPFYFTVNNRKVCEIRTAMIEVIDSAKENVILEHAYFSDDRMIDAIVLATRRGVKITIILPQNPGTHLYANMSTINKLLARCPKDKCEIYFYPGMTHAKVMMVDGTIAIIGSANLTHRSMKRSRELVLFANGKENEPFIRRLRERLSADINKAKRVTEPFDLSVMERVSAFAGKYTW